MHAEGYTFIGPTAITKLTLPEVRVLREGIVVQNEQQAHESGNTVGTGEHARPRGRARQSDVEWVQELASQSD